MILRLHGYWRSSAAYRVRIALTLKGVGFDQVTHDLRAGAQAAPDNAALNPQKLVPALQVEERVLTQSPAILEWLKEAYPVPALFPGDAIGRATVRAMAALVACDIHPLNNLRVLKTLRGDFHADETAVSAWIARWIAEGLTALETLIARYGAGFACGDTPTIADCYLLPQIYSARRFAVNLAAFPHSVAASDRLAELAAVAEAQPDRQADAS